jgi:hypothetical protein
MPRAASPPRNHSRPRGPTTHLTAPTRDSSLPPMAGGLARGIPSSGRSSYHRPGRPASGSMPPPSRYGRLVVSSPAASYLTMALRTVESMNSAGLRWITIVVRSPLDMVEGRAQRGAGSEIVLTLQHDQSHGRYGGASTLCGRKAFRAPIRYAILGPSRAARSPRRPRRDPSTATRPTENRVLA